MTSAAFTIGIIAYDLHEVSILTAEANIRCFAISTRASTSRAQFGISIKEVPIRAKRALRNCGWVASQAISGCAMST